MFGRRRRIKLTWNELRDITRGHRRMMLDETIRYLRECGHHPAADELVAKRGRHSL